MGYAFVIILIIACIFIIVKNVIAIVKKIKERKELKKDSSVEIENVDNKDFNLEDK